MSPDLKRLRVEDGKPVDDVSAEVRVDVLGLEFALVGSIDGPIGEIWNQGNIVNVKIV